MAKVIHNWCLSYILDWVNSGLGLWILACSAPSFHKAFTWTNLSSTATLKTNVSKIKIHVQKFFSRK